jgi:hexosaminidase
MRLLTIFTFIILCSINQAYAQHENQFSSKDLILTWKSVQENYNPKGETLSELTLINAGKANLPATGWTIYFNGPQPYSLEKDTSTIGVKHINGDFFKLYPKASFKGLTAGKEIRFKLISRPIRNITDYGKGFYIVFENNPNPITIEIKESVEDRSKAEREISNLLFKQNEMITNVNNLPPVFPTPMSFSKSSGNFLLTGSVKISSDQSFITEAKYLSKELGKVLDREPHIGNVLDSNVIVLQRAELPLGEAYRLKIAPKRITITASQAAGIFYGIQSLKVMLAPESWKTKQTQLSLPCIEINDAPRFGHRAFMMDIARNFLPKSTILKTLDMLSLYKINVLHLHFNDDEGWRIEINGLPELTEVGSKRGHTLTEDQWLIPAYGSGPSPQNATGTGYLSRGDFIEILKYATQRHIKVIPEYETPGHARAAIKSMDARYARLMSLGKEKEAEVYLLRDLKDRSVYRSVQGFNDNVINPALPATYRFIEKIIDETLAMYKEAKAPLQTIHFGGDEVPTGVWEKSPIALQFIKSNSQVKSIDELWFYYFQKVDAMLKARNLYLSGWEEIGLRKVRKNDKAKMELDKRAVAQNFHTDVWNNLSGNEDLAYQLANAGYKVVLTNVTNMYLDLAYNKSYAEPGQYWGGYVDVDKPFSFIPFDYYKNQQENKLGKPLPANYYHGKMRANETGKKNIIGLQAPLWSEIIKSTAEFEYLLLPKVLGLAERSWAADPDWAIESDPIKSKSSYQTAWSVFVNQLGKFELPRLNYYAGGFNYRIPSPGYIVENGYVKVNVLYPGLSIRFTTDGSEPTSNSQSYQNHIPFSKNLKLKAFDTRQRGGKSVQVYE